MEHTMSKRDYNLTMKHTKKKGRIAGKWELFPREYLVSLKADGITDEQIADMFDIPADTVTKAAEMLHQYKLGQLPKELESLLQPTYEEMEATILEQAFGR